MCCDLSEEWTAIARRFWERAGVADRIDLRIGPALDTLRALPFDPPVDLAFIDAAKAEYVDYYEELVPRLAERGVILADNVLWDGHVADPARDDAPHQGPAGLLGPCGGRSPGDGGAAAGGRRPVDDHPGPGLTGAASYAFAAPGTAASPGTAAAPGTAALAGPSLAASGAVASP